MLTDIINIATASLASLGLSSVILIKLSSWLGKIWAERIMSEEKNKYDQQIEDFKNRLSNESEQHKTKLKKSELIFSKEFEAASALVALNSDVLPIRNDSEMDWYDACDEIVRNFKKSEIILNQYLKHHGAILPAGVKQLIRICFNIESNYKYQNTGNDISHQANEAADMFYEQLNKAEYEMISHIQTQSSV